jgi:hypothetical protein
MKFERGNKVGRGGKRPGAGRPTKQEAAAKLAFLRALERERDKRGARLAQRYFDMAEQDPATMRHVVDKVLANAKQDVEHSGLIVHEIQTNVPDDED